jgi:ketosteroid isomerase-like protein
MKSEEAHGLMERFLAAWNSQDVQRVLDFYTEDCIYRDPGTRGVVNGHAGLRRYLTKLFQGWTMTWTLREYLPFGGTEGGALLWKARLTPARGGPAKEVEGMDLVVLRGDRLARNEVYFDRTALVAPEQSV